MTGVDAGTGEPATDASTARHDEGPPSAADTDGASRRRAELSPGIHALAGLHPATLPGSAAPGTAAPTPPAFSPQASPDQPQAFAQETSQYISWLVGQGFDRAEIHLNPRELGPIHVEITQTPEQIDVNFAVQHPQTVHALQQVLPQLHDMLAQQGLNLGQASVGQQSPGHRHPAPTLFAGGRNRAAARVGDMAPRSGRWLQAPVPGGVDDFA